MMHAAEGLFLGRVRRGRGTDICGVAARCQVFHQFYGIFCMWNEETGVQRGKRSRPRPRSWAGLGLASCCLLCCFCAFAEDTSPTWEGVQGPAGTGCRRKTLGTRDATSVLPVSPLLWLVLLSRYGWLFGQNVDVLEGIEGILGPFFSSSMPFPCPRVLNLGARPCLPANLQTQELSAGTSNRHLGPHRAVTKLLLSSSSRKQQPRGVCVTHVSLKSEEGRGELRRLTSYFC